MTIGHDQRQTFFPLAGKTYNLIQCVEEFPTGSKMSRQMLKTETICKRFFLVARVLFGYLMVELKMFLGIFFCTVEQGSRVLLLV